MNRDIIAKSAAILLFFVMAGGTCQTTFRIKEPQAPSGASTWSIVAIDPATGDVGAAGASCVPVNAAVLAALVPGKGAAATQAEFVIENRDKVFELLQAGLTAGEILDQMTSSSADSNLALRQYGIVTLTDGLVEAVGFTGDGNFDWAGDQQDPRSAVSAQGNTLESEEVVTHALAAFQAEGGGPLPMADRLIRALEAGSAAGGDKRCNQDGLRQTALSAFVIVLQADQEPFAAPFSASTSLDGPVVPWLYASVIEEAGGPNPVIELRRQYNSWRETHLPRCPLCEQFPIEVPAGGMELEKSTRQSPSQQQQTVEPDATQADPASSATPRQISTSQPGDSGESTGAGPDPIIFLVSIVLVVVVAVVVIYRLRRSRMDV
jgi:uncharacterized Ntn-hydrolase superfamily protein